MSYLVVCRLNQIAESAVLHGAREMISLMAENQPFHRPGVIDPERHLKLGVNDIFNAQEGLVVPGEAHVSRIIAFARNWDQRAPLIIHCWMGISRSPATAAIVALALAPDQDDMELGQRLRAASPLVTPNQRLIEIGDAMLERGGRLVRSIKTIGRGAEALEGSRFCFGLRAKDEVPPATPEFSANPAGRE